MRRLLPVGYPGLEFFRRQRFAVKKPLDFVAIHGLKGIELCLRFRSYDGGGCGSPGRAAAEAKGKDQKQEKILHREIPTQRRMTTTPPR